MDIFLTSRDQGLIFCHLGLQSGQYQLLDILSLSPGVQLQLWLLGCEAQLSHKRCCWSTVSTSCGQLAGWRVLFCHTVQELWVAEKPGQYAGGSLSGWRPLASVPLQAGLRRWDLLNHLSACDSGQCYNCGPGSPRLLSLKA